MNLAGPFLFSYLLIYQCPGFAFSIEPHVARLWTDKIHNLWISRLTICERILKICIHGFNLRIRDLTFESAGSGFGFKISFLGTATKHSRPQAKDLDSKAEHSHPQIE